jgi:hypothetical protein
MPYFEEFTFLLKGRATQWWFVSLRGGTTITRRPNKRASREYAPGPRSASAAASNIGKTEIRLPEWEPINRFATADAQAITAKNGVKKPILRDRAINKAHAKSRYMEDTPGRFAAFIRKVAATEILSSNNANPGPP